MPRGKRKVAESFEEEILAIDAQIAELTKKIKELKEKKRGRIKDEEKNKDANKWEQLKNSGLSVDEILAMIGKPK